MGLYLSVRFSFRQRLVWFHACIFVIQSFLSLSLAFTFPTPWSFILSLAQAKISILELFANLINPLSNLINLPLMLRFLLLFATFCSSELTKELIKWNCYAESGLDSIIQHSCIFISEFIILLHGYRFWFFLFPI